MQLLSSSLIPLQYIIMFLNSLSKGLYKFFTLKQIVSFKTRLKCIISDYNQSHIMQELCTWG